MHTHTHTHTHIHTHLAGQNVPEGTKDVIQSFVVNRLVEILDENVANTRATEGGVTLRPHDTTWSPLDEIVVHGA